MDRVNLSSLLPGHVYEVPLGLGTFLLCSGTAEEDTTPTIAVITSIAGRSAKPAITISTTPPDTDSTEY